MFGLALAWLRTQLARAQLKHLWQAGMVTVLCATAGFGGLATASPLKPVSLEQPYVNGPLRITASSLLVGCKAGDLPAVAGYDVRNGQIAVVLRVTIENLVDEDIPFGSGQATTVFELQSAKHKDAYVGVFPDKDSVAAVDIAARMTMNVMVIWRLSAAELNGMAMVEVVIRDLQKAPSTLVPAWRWFPTVRKTGGVLIVPQTRC